MTIENGFEIITSAITNTTLFNISWIISILFVTLTLLIITRDITKWKALAFPVTILWHIIGITPSFIFYIITGIIFVIEALSIQQIGEILQTITKTTIKTGQQTKKIIQNIPKKELLTKLKKFKIGKKT